MRSARLDLALDSGAFLLPATGQVLVLRPRAGDDLTPLGRDRVVVQTGFRPDHDHFAAQGFTVGEATLPRAAVVCLPRSRAAALALIALAEDALPDDAQILIDGQKTDGIDAILKACRAAGYRVGEVISKAHGKAAVLQAAQVPEDWRLRDRAVDCGPMGEFWTNAFCFSADGADRGSALLARRCRRSWGRRWSIWGGLGVSVARRSEARRRQAAGCG